jgi:hypothetical protein
MTAFNSYRAPLNYTESIDFVGAVAIAALLATMHWQLEQGHVDSFCAATHRIIRLQ